MIDIVTDVIGVGIFCFVYVLIRDTMETHQDVENASVFADMKKGFSYAYWIV